MKLTRRKFIGTAAALGAGGAMSHLDAATPPAPPPAPAPKRAATVEQTTADAVRYFTARGYARIAAAPLVTGLPFNGGLNFGEHFSPAADGLFVVQPCARVEDAAKPDKTGFLPLFTMFAFSPSAKISKPHRTRLALEFLTGALGLDPWRLRITSTELVKPLFPIFERFGVSEAQVRMRPLDEARSDGAGSGWFAPAGHPDSPAYATFSIEYVLGNGVEIEIAEIAVDATTPYHGGAALGLERVTMARNDRLMTWKEQLPAFRKAVEENARQTGRPLPDGYYTILGITPPGKAAPG